MQKYGDAFRKSSSIYPCPQDVKVAAYKGHVRPVLEYGSSSWDPQGVIFKEKLESVQKHVFKQKKISVKL